MYYMYEIIICMGYYTAVGAHSRARTYEYKCVIHNIYTYVGSYYVYLITYMYRDRYIPG